jgi:hypothetical protein
MYIVEAFMSAMIRKQIYIHRRQETLLKRQARLRGVSEAEIIRQAIDREAERVQPFTAQYDHSAWKEILQFVEERKKLGITGEPYRWNRQEIYEERENCWLREGSQKQE